MPESNQQSSPIARELYDCLRRDFGPMDIPWDTLAAVRSLVEQLETLRGTLEQIAGPTPTSHRKTVDQLTDAVKWRQGMARDALARIGSNPAMRPDDA